MNIKSAKYLKSATKLKDCPQDASPDFAFIGRSNVGKSSLINMLVGKKQLAKTSGRPGKTQTINFFLINGKWHLVDLPGYGWAGVSKDKKKEWSGFVRDYLLNRVNLYCLFILVDIRHEPQKIDLEFIFWAGSNQIPVGIVFTKADKISKNKIDLAVNRYKNRLQEDWETIPALFVTSSRDQRGRNELLEYIISINSA